MKTSKVFDAVSAVILLAIALTLLSWVVCLAVGCGPSASQTRAAYPAATNQCIENERAIVDRTGTTPEQDAQDLAIERARCDAQRARIRRDCGRHCR